MMRTTKRTTTGALLACGLLALACGPTSHVVIGDPDSGTPTGPADGGPLPNIPIPGQTVSEMVGPEGGTVALGDLELTVPAGALAEMTMITMSATSDAAPTSFTAYSPVYRFEPAGLSFASPVTVRLPFDGRLTTASVFWTSGGTGAYTALSTRIEGRVAITESMHFSSAFVGSACAGDDCCRRANGELDVLLMVDNSNSMTEEQASLVEQLPRLARVLASGDLDEDGVQDFPAVASLSMGTITTDMGTGGYTVPTCASSDFGDDGVLRTDGNTEMPGCMASYPPFLRFEAAVDGDFNQFALDVGCVANVGIGGCGFEQPLDAVLKALTPSTSGTTFFGGSRGHADGANAGFARPESLLAAILVTDENDCSAIDPQLFDQSSGPYASTNLNLRCWSHPEALHPVSRYVDGLRSLRENPNDVFFGLIAGIPTDLTGADAATILADPRLEERIDPAMSDRLMPSCNEVGRGVAFPPNRMLEVARDLGPNAVATSICQEDFTPVIDAIVARLSARVAGRCGD